MTPRFGTGPQNDTASRRVVARSISRHPDRYMVCEGCGSICTLIPTRCPMCHAYRFDTGAESVLAAASALGKKKSEPLRLQLAEDPEN